jgi:threonine dehydratase
MINYIICKEQLKNIIEIDVGHLCMDIIDIYQNEGIIVEPAGILSISALDKMKTKGIVDKDIVCIVSGGNNDISRYPEIIDRSLRYQNLKFYFIVEFVQKPGELKRFINNILGENDDIIRFEYIKKTNIEQGNVLIGVEVQNSFIKENINEKLFVNKFQYYFINEDNILFDYLI